MKLNVGDEAPLLTAESVNKGAVRLEDYRGRMVLLVFGRYFGCPVCKLDFDRLLEMIEDEAHGFDVIYVTQSSSESSKEYLEGLDVEFPVIPAENINGRYPLYDDYGVGRIGLTTMPGLLRRAREARKAGKVHGPYEGIETQSPADFVIDEGGRIVWAHIGLLEPNRVLSFLRKT
jgi:peroxiredoxin Q/BCP